MPASTNASYPKQSWRWFRVKQPSSHGLELCRICRGIFRTWSGRGCRRRRDSCSHWSCPQAPRKRRLRKKLSAWGDARNASFRSRSVLIDICKSHKTMRTYPVNLGPNTEPNYLPALVGPGALVPLGRLLRNPHHSHPEISRASHFMHCCAKQPV